MRRRLAVRESVNECIHYFGFGGFCFVSYGVFLLVGTTKK